MNTIDFFDSCPELWKLCEIQSYQIVIKRYEVNRRPCIISLKNIPMEFGYYLHQMNFFLQWLQKEDLFRLACQQNGDFFQLGGPHNLTSCIHHSIPHSWFCGTQVNLGFLEMPVYREIFIIMHIKWIYLIQPRHLPFGYCTSEVFFQVYNWLTMGKIWINNEPGELFLVSSYSKGNLAFRP